MSQEMLGGMGREARAWVALEGLSVGDALGERFFVPPMQMLEAWRARAVPGRAPWRYTDDTEMALALMETLLRHGRVEQDELAQSFARRYGVNPYRGYGPGAIQLLEAIRDGGVWEVEARELFRGMGSLGNGGAMRVAPLGAWFADDLGQVVLQARRSAEVTHGHAEGQAGAIAVAVAAAWAWRHRGKTEVARGLLRAAYEWTPDGETRRGLQAAMELPWDTPPHKVAAELGNGARVTAPDTVPGALWCAARFVDSYEEAMWGTVGMMGDIDTNCAIVGGVVACFTGVEGIPAEWRASREALPSVEALRLAM
jgi:ADP-ribosylglycohydrolase